MIVAILAYIIFALIGVGFFIVGAANDVRDDAGDQLPDSDQLPFVPPVHLPGDTL